MAKMQSIIRRAMCAVTLLGMTSSAALHQRTTQQVFAADKHLEGMFKEKYSYTVTEQDDTLCDAGTRQWTGSINVTDKKSIFFCKSQVEPGFDSRDNLQCLMITSAQGLSRAEMIRILIL